MKFSLRNVLGWVSVGRVGTDIDARDGAIGKNENGSGGVDVLLDLIHNAVPVEFVLPNAADVGQRRCLEDANFGRVLLILTTFTIHTYTYHYAILARGS